MKSTEIFESSPGDWCLHLLFMKKWGLGLFQDGWMKHYVQCLGCVAGAVCWETLEEVPGVEMKVRAIGNIHHRQLFMNIKEHLRVAASSNRRRKHTHTIMSSMQAVLLVTQGLSLNTRLDIKHFPSFMQQLSSARNVRLCLGRRKKNLIFWIAGCIKSNILQLHKCRTNHKQDTFRSAAILLNSMQEEHVFLLYHNRSSQHGAVEAF